jgi:KR domain
MSDVDHVVQRARWKPGQIASSYVSANSFMDSLATYRHNSGLPAASLQLGAWESCKSSFVWTQRSCLRLRRMPRIHSSRIASLLPSTKTASSGINQKLSAAEATKIVVDILRVALELQPNEKLGALKLNGYRRFSSTLFCFLQILRNP